MLYDKILDAPRPYFSIPPPPKSNKDSHVGDGVIGTTSMKSTKATSKKARKISDQNANEEILASEVNAVSTDKRQRTEATRRKEEREEKKEEI